jgi:hypothetical protein
MKIFSLRNILGALAIYGVVQYSRKHGGFRNAFNELLGKAKELAQQSEERMRSSSMGSSGGSSGRSGTVDEQRTGYGSGGSTGYPGSR